MGHREGNGRGPKVDTDEGDEEMAIAREALRAAERLAPAQPTETAALPGNLFLRLAGEFEFIGDGAWARRANPLHFIARNAIQAGMVAALWFNSWAWFGGLVAAYFAAWRLIPPPRRKGGLFARIADGERIWIREGSRLAKGQNLLLGFALSPQFYVCFGVYFAGVLGYFAWYHYAASTTALFMIIAWYKGVFAWWALKIADEQAAERASLAAPPRHDEPGAADERN